MNIKKTSKADLENKRTVFFLLGLIVAGASLYVLLNWQTEENLSPDWAGFDLLTVEEVLTPEEIALTETKKATVIQPSEILPEKTTPTVVYESFKLVAEVTDKQDTLIAEPPADSLKKELEKEQTQAVTAPIYSEAETMPQYPGGYAALNRFIFQNLNYPASAVTQKKQGRVWCSFVINQDGSVTDIKPEQGVYISLDQEALRVLRLMPRWTAGTVRGQNVRVKIYLPIVFKL